MTKTERRKMWEERVSAFQASGQAQTVWCKEQGIPLHQLRYWLKKFRSEKLFQSSSLEWVLVEIDKNKRKFESSNASILVTVGQATIEVRDGFDPLLLSKVVKVLSAHAERDSCRSCLFGTRQYSRYA